MRHLRFALPLSVLLLASTAFGQTTGGLTGRVTDSSGAALPGVTVEVRSPALQGARTDATDQQGSYRFSILPPGSYEVRFALDGFSDEARRDVRIALGKDSSIDVVLRPATVSESLTVIASAPVLDTTSSSVGTNLDSAAIETLPTGRNYASIVQVAPGVSSDANPSNATQNTITVYGSSGAENAFYIDGVNTTQMEYGFQGKNLNFEFIQEVDVKTGGYEAEFGRSTGGIINVITKSGSRAISSATSTPTRSRAIPKRSTRATEPWLVSIGAIGAQTSVATSFATSCGFSERSIPSITPPTTSSPDWHPSSRARPVRTSARRS